MIIHNNQIFLINSRKSVTTAEKCESSLGQLEADFPSLVNSTKNNEYWKWETELWETSTPVNL